MAARCLNVWSLFIFTSAPTLYLQFSPQTSISPDTEFYLLGCCCCCFRGFLGGWEGGWLVQCSFTFSHWPVVLWCSDQVASKPPVLLTHCSALISLPPLPSGLKASLQRALTPASAFLPSLTTLTICLLLPSPDPLHFPFLFQQGPPVCLSTIHILHLAGNPWSDHFSFCFGASGSVVSRYLKAIPHKRNSVLL